MDSEKIILGIDLGTTYSCVAYVDETERPMVIPNAEGELTTPSVVYFEDTENIVVGKVAKANAVLYKDLVVECVKRDMGDPSFSRLIWDTEYKPEMVSSLILRKIVKDAEQYLGFEEGTLKNVVITCPAYFGINERAATKNAGELAGLNVLRIMNEPTAAAFCYGLTRSKDAMKVLVYDLGGGTFDITLISVEENKVEVLLTDGKKTLGGKDWDGIITNYLADQFVAEFGEEDGHPLDDPETEQQIQLDAEEAKKALSAQKKRGVVVSHGGNRHKVEITREKFDELTDSKLQETLDTTRRLLDRARDEKGITQVDKLLLVGGSTKMPQVKDGLSKAFGLDGELYDPDQSVAKGAAIIGKFILDGVIPYEEVETDAGDPSGPKRFLPETKVAADKQLSLVDVASKSFGIAIINDQDVEIVDHLIKNQTPLPTEKVEVYGTYSDNQSAVDLRIFEQAGADESEVLDDNKLICENRLALPPGLPKGEPIEVTFRLSPDGRLQVTGRHKAKVIEIEANVDGVMSKDEMKKAATLLKKMDVS